MKFFGIGRLRAERQAQERAHIEELEAQLQRLREDAATAQSEGRHERVALLERKMDEVNERLVMTLDLRGFDTL